MISQRESDALNLIRWSSTLAIIWCHILQGHGNVYAWVFNIGVQVFFFLSGFLYGNKRIDNIPKFYRSRIVKLYIPYFLWVLVAVGLLWLFAPELPTAKAVVNQLLMRYNMRGLSHLWFMYVIFVCYLWLPLIDRGMSAKPALTVTLGVALMALLMAFRFNPNYMWICVYYGGYLCGRYRRLCLPVLLVSGLCVAAIMFQPDFTVETFRSDSFRSNLLHAAWGAALFLGVFLVVAGLNMNKRISQILTIGGVRSLSHSSPVHPWPAIAAVYNPI